MFFRHSRETFSGFFLVYMTPHASICYISYAYGYLMLGGYLTTVSSLPVI